MAGSLTRTKPIDQLLAETASTGEHTLKRTLGPGALIALGIGAIIGAGLFVRTAAAIADRSGPSVTLAFIVAGVGCALAGLCYAEFASMIPIAWWFCGATCSARWSNGGGIPGPIISIGERRRNPTTASPRRGRASLARIGTIQSLSQV